MLRTVNVTRYVTPLREGGSLPAIVEADDDGLYVLKFRGAGQGPKALIAELVAGEIGRALGLPVPEIVFAELDVALGRNEMDPEIQMLIKASPGLNLGLDYLPGSLAFDPAVASELDPALASAVVWFDAYVTNVDRTPRNTNMLLWHKKLWLIDHGASLYFQHSWGDYLARSLTPFSQVKGHVLLPYASQIAVADQTLRPLLTTEKLQEILAQVPAEWLAPEQMFTTSEEMRSAFLTFLVNRLENSHVFVEEAVNARTKLL
ncbi:MAG: aminotransferase class I and II [Chloroflexi bacterium]|nr:aminotransferase class I and II [Chloroflexota bacterium]OJV99836.1 MAG: aminotransferase class I and II [Chloroflexi bacterium 54-19]